MNLRLKVCIALICYLAGSLAEPTEVDEAAVLALTEDSFDDFIEDHPFVLAEFYAPWCGHCKQLAPEYESAAKTLAEKGSTVRLVKIDATIEKDLGSRFEVTGYPTLKFFRNGKAEEFDGGRSADSIVEFCESRSDPNYKPPPEAVVAINSQEEFDAFIVSGELTLVEFYAPWCGHCKKLAPEYEKAAKDLIKNDPPIKLAKVDATANADLAKQFDVTGYPTLKMFRAKPNADGEMVAKPFEYTGPREHHGIVNYLTAQVGDAATRVKTLKELKSMMLLDDIIVVGMFSSTEDNAGYDKYQEAANVVREKYALFYTTNDEIRKRYNVADKAAAVVVIQPELMVTKHDEPFNTLIVEEQNPAEILGFIDAHETPLIGTRSKNTKDRYTRRPLCILFVPVNWSHEFRQMTAAWRDKLLPVAYKFRSDFHFAMSDDEEMDADVKAFGFEDSGSDFSFGCFGGLGDKYPMQEIDEWDQEEVEEFLSAVLKGKAKPYLRSQIPPKKQTKPVYTVTGKTFQQIVMDPTKDVLIELYAPWCGHCKKFEPEYKKFAKSLSSEKNLIIAKMNAEANDAPDMYSVQGYPTIYLAPAGNKDTPVKYEGNRDVDDLKKFLVDNAQVSFKNGKDEL